MLNNYVFHKCILVLQINVLLFVSVYVKDMALSTSRQQFLACETQGLDDIHYGRKGGIFISTCICISFIVFAVILSFIVGVIVYFVTYFKVCLSKNLYIYNLTSFCYKTKNCSLILLVISFC